jgi:plasmid stabilization system protein ParE
VKSVSVQRLAEQDIFAAIDYYPEHAPKVIERFMKAVDRATFSIGDSPGVGSPTFAEVLDILGCATERSRRSRRSRMRSSTKSQTTTSGSCASSTMAATS